MCIVGCKSRRRVQRVLMLYRFIYKNIWYIFFCKIWWKKFILIRFSCDCCTTHIEKTLILKINDLATISLRFFFFLNSLSISLSLCFSFIFSFFSSQFPAFCDRLKFFLFLFLKAYLITCLFISGSLGDNKQQWMMKKKWALVCKIISESGTRLRPKCFLSVHYRLTIIMKYII